MVTIVNYTAENYEKCLNMALPTWKADKIIVYSDTDKFGINKYEPTEDFDEHCRRKILSVQDAIKNNMGDNIAYLDTDVLMKEDFSEVFENNFDLIVTRMVRRGRKHFPEINAGVFFLKANEKTLKMCDLWLEKDLEYRGKHKYPEQHALNDIAFMGYDGLIDLKVSNVSEEIYNYERDNSFLFVQDIKKPKLIHLKKRLWEHLESLEMAKNI